jgi:hypothetical protein
MWSALFLIAACGSPAPEGPSGRWFPAPTDRPDPPLTAEQRQEMEQLESLGYAQGTLPPPAGGSGVVRFDRSRTAPGRRFFVSGDAPVAHLIERDGTVVHTWTSDFWTEFPDSHVSHGNGSTENWRRARLLPDGSILAIHEGLGMVRLDRDSRVIWANPGKTHHDLQVLLDVPGPSGALTGKVVALARRAQMDPSVSMFRPILVDSVVWLDLADGHEIQRFDLTHAAIRSKWADTLVPSAFFSGGDLLHTNGLQVLDGSLVSKNPAFAAGNVLISFREPSALVVLDVKTGELVWCLRGPFALQHDPRLGPDGITLFDNSGLETGARALRIDPSSGAILWEWDGLPGAPLRSPTLGTVGMAGPNLIVTESEAGTAWEVTPGGEVVWEYVNPARAGPDGSLIAALFEMAAVTAPE